MIESLDYVSFTQEANDLSKFCLSIYCVSDLLVDVVCQLQTLVLIN